MSSVADIWNQALGHIGVADEIQSPDTETSKEATACRRFWTVVRDSTLRDFPWPRLKVTQALAHVATDPNDQWGFSYRMPVNCATVRRLVVETSPRVDTQATAVPFELGRDDTGELIFTDQDTASIEFTYLETNTERYPSDVVDTMALLLASKIAARFGPQAVKLGDRALKVYEWRRGVAAANALNETQPDISDDSSFLSARG